MKKKIALACIAKNEDDYIQEWIDYYKKIGFNDIFIFQNDWRWKGESENVHKIEFDGRGVQQNAYNTFVHYEKENFEWVAFFDVDEFLVLKKHNNIIEFLNEYANLPAIGINEVLFGNNYLTNKTEEKSVLKRFTRRRDSVDMHVKSIIRLDQDFHMFTHNPNIVWYCTERLPHTGPFNHEGKIDIAQLNHYFCKTNEEFLDKIEKGLADNPIERRTFHDFDRHNFNEIEDLHAMNFLYNQ